MSEQIDGPAAPDGGAPYLSWNLDAHELEPQEAQVLQVLGAALLSRWYELPRDVQEAIFDKAAPQPTIDGEGLRGKLARFLHDNAEQKSDRHET